MSSSTAVTRDYGKRVAIVTGSSRGIGRSIAIRLAEDGFDVCINDISANREGIDSVVSEIKALGRNSCGCVADVSKSEEVEALVASCVQHLGPLNVMVANAGIAQVKAAMDLTDEDLRRMFDINVFGLFNSYRAAARQMIKQGNGGQIIGAASIVAFKPFALLAHYSASKFAVRGFTQAMAMELAEHKITVNAYAPGVVGTAMWDLIDAEMGKTSGAEKGATFKSMERNILLGRTSVPEDVAKTVSYLASPDALYMTGQTLVVDGGMVFPESKTNVNLARIKGKGKLGEDPEALRGLARLTLVSKSRVRRQRQGNYQEHISKSPVATKFVVPLAGVLSAVSARLYDMGHIASRRTSQLAQQDVRGGDSRNNDEPDDTDHLPFHPIGRHDLPEQQTPSTPRRTIIAILTCLAVFSIVSATAFILGVKLVNIEIPVCLERSCITAASKIITNLSPDYPTVDPCLSFNEYVCGGWDLNDATDNRAPTSTFSSMINKRNEALRRILENDGTSSRYSSPSIPEGRGPVNIEASAEMDIDQKLKDFYRSCMDESAIDNEGLRPVKEMIMEIVEHFPEKPNASEVSELGRQGLANTISFLAGLGVSSLISFSDVVHPNDASKLILQIGLPLFGLPLSEYQSNSHLLRARALREYENQIAASFERFSYPLRQSDNTSYSRWRDDAKGALSQAASNDHKRAAKLVVTLESALAEGADLNNGKILGSQSSTMITQPWNPLSLAQINKLLPELDINKITKTFVPPGYISELVNVPDLRYLIHGANVVRESSRESLQSYFTWKAISTYERLVLKDKVKDDILEATNGNDSPEKRWNICVSDVVILLGPLISHFYARQYLPVTVKNQAEDIVDGVRFALLHNLRKHMSTTSGNSILAAAIEKLEGLTAHIGYSTKLLDAPFLASEYGALSVSPTKYFQNTIDARRFLIRVQFSDLGKVRDPRAWSPLSNPDLPLQLTPLYDTLSNVMTIPAALMQSSIFSPKVPSYLNFGTFGSIAGHMASHVFNGVEIGSASLTADLWHQQPSAKLELRGQPAYECSVVSSLPSQSLVFGSSEAAADIIGLEAAFDAWTNLTSNGESDMKLPGMDIWSKEQIFFLRFGGLWCGGADGIGTGFEGLRTNLKGRLDGAITGSEAFRSAWGCKAVERMECLAI